MFQGLVNFHGDLSGWDTSGVTSMNIMFGGSSNFSGNLSDWNTSSVTSINSMFDGSSNFHGDLSGWDTSSVTSMDGLFLASSNFSGNLSDWNTSSVTSMNGLFLASSNFSGDISGWDTSSVTSMNYALSSSTNFHSDLSDWDTSGVTSMNNMFSSSTNININLSNWNTSSVTSINSMFDGSSNFHGDIGNWDTSSVTSMDGLFYNSKNFNADLRNWNFTSVNETILMFSKTTMPLDTFDKILYAINKTTIGDVNSINNLNYTSGRSAQIIQDLLNAGWNITNCNEITDEFAPSVKYSIEELGVDNYLLNIYDAWDPNLDSVWYSVDGVNHTYTSPTNVSRNVAIYANDTYGNIFSNATIICELKNIVLSITSPVDEEIYNMNIDVVVSANEEVELFYNLNENDVNISCTDDCIIDSQDLLEGNNTITIYGKDTCENIGKQTLNFVVDKSNPELFIISPRDAETYNERTQLLNLSVSDTTLDTVLFDYRGYNTTYTEPILVNFNDGLNTLKVYVNDSFGRTNYSEITLTINESLETNDESPSGSRAGGSQISEIGVPLNMSSIINITDNVGIGYIKTYNEKDMITFAYEAENYNLTVENIVPNETIDVKISSDEHSDKTKSLSSGENWNVDLDDDYIEDINVRVHSIKEKNTSIEIEDIKNETEILENETIVEYPSEVVQKESNLSWNVFLLNYPTVLLGTDWVAWGIVIISGFLIYLIIRTIKIAKIVRKEEEYYAEIRKKASSVKSKMNFKK